MKLLIKSMTKVAVLMTLLQCGWHSAFAQSQEDGKAALVAFDSWAERYRTASPVAGKAQMHTEGVVLAKQRRVAFAEIIKADPERALAMAVPNSVRQSLPTEIANELEAHVSGVGDFSVLCAIRAKEGPSVEAIQRFVHLDGQTYRAYTYGRRSGETTKYGIPLHGVAVDGVLALDENALRELPLDEPPDVARAAVDLRTPAEKSAGTAAVILAEMGGKTYRFATREQLRQAEALIEAAEAGVGPELARSASLVLESGALSTQQSASAMLAQNSAWTEGLKKILILRLDFSDLPGEPYTVSYLQNVADTQVAPYYQQSSYGITSLTNTISTQVYRMPNTGASYAKSGDTDQLLADAKTAAAANYALGNYDRIILVFAKLSGLPFDGNAELGGTNVWVNGNFNFAVVAHELGHTYGVLHANLWQVSDGNPLSDSGSSAEYGDDFDPMGLNPAQDARADFNPWYKNRLNWIHDSQVQTVTSSGTYRANRFDDSTATGTLALKVVKDSRRNYWIGCRRKFTDNASMQNGAYIVWGYNVNTNSNLLDMTTPGRSDQDAALAIGATFIDSDAGVAIRPVAEGGVAPHEYLDVQVIFGPVAPVISLQPADQIVTPGQTAFFAVGAASIPAPAYLWQRQAKGTGIWTTLQDGSSYHGATIARLAITGTTSAMNGDSFRCLVSNSQGTIVSFPAVLTVIPFGVTTLAGQAGSFGYADGTAIMARFGSPFGIAADGAGNVYVADSKNDAIRRISRAGFVSTLAGLAGHNSSGYEDGPVSTARFWGPAGVAVDAQGNVYVADQFNSTIRKVSPAGVVSTVAGLARSLGATDSNGPNARFYYPEGVAVDGVGNLYVADTQNYTIRKITPSGTNWVVSTLAGGAGSPGTADGSGSNARFAFPAGIAVDTAGTVYVADYHSIRKITPAGMVSTLAAGFYFSTGVAVDNAGNVYAADRNNTIQRISRSGTVGPLAGVAFWPGSADGVGSDARFDDPTGVAVDGSGNLYVADRLNNTIRKYVFPRFPLQLTGMSRNNGISQFALNGPADVNYIVQSSPDLVNWVPLSTNVIPAEGRDFIFDSSAAGQPRRFYRVMVKP